jgi:hypothetical protein
MTSSNKAKYEAACAALKCLGMTAQDFIDLNMADCFACWAEDDPLVDPTPMTVDSAMDIHLDTGYFKTLMERALVL